MIQFSNLYSVLDLGIMYFADQMARRDPRWVVWIWDPVRTWPSRRKICW